jgi:hypothetical protein
MTDQVIRKAVEEALNISAVEKALVEIISDELDPRGIAQVIWTMYGVDILEAAAEVAAESLLPF